MRDGWFGRSAMAAMLAAGVLLATGLGAAAQGDASPPPSGAEASATVSAAPTDVGPSASDPVATVNTLLDMVVGRRFDRIASFSCPPGRAALDGGVNLAAALAASLPQGVDPSGLIDALTITIPDRAVSLVSRDGTTAVVDVKGTIVVTADQEALRPWVAGLLQALGQDASDAAVTATLPTIVAEVATSRDISGQVHLVLSDGLWLVCETGAAAPSPLAAASSPTDRLLAAIPEPLRSRCAPAPDFTTSPQSPGELAEAYCDPDPTDAVDHATQLKFVDLSLFDTTAQMDAYYEQQRADVALTGSGCFTGPGETTWARGRLFCYESLARNVFWTDEAARIVGWASLGTSDWSALEAFWRDAVGAGR